MSRFRRHSTRRLTIWLPVLISITAAPALFAQIEGVQATSDEIIIKARNGESYRVSELALDEKSIRVSPDGQRIVYHPIFHGYGTDPRLPLKLWSLVQPNSLVEIKVPTYSRYIDTVEWMGDRNILAAGDGHGVIIDIQGGGATHNFWGRFRGEKLIFLSPDRQKIVYANGVGRVPREFISDVAALAVLGKGRSPSLKRRGPNSGVTEIYPPRSDPTRGTPAPIPERRHHFLSEFLWFSDSQRVVFVEEQDGTAWLVVLRLRLGDSAVFARGERIPLPVAPGKVDELVWVSQDEALRVVIDGKDVVVDPAKRTVQHDGQIDRVSGVMAVPDQQELAREVLSESVEVQGRALQGVAGIPRDEIGPGLRAAIIKALERENTKHMHHRLADRAGKHPPPLKAPEMYFQIGEAVIELRDPASIPALAGALGTGTAVARALAAFGLQAVPTLLEVVTAVENDPSEVNNGLLALRFIAEKNEAQALKGNLRDQVVAAARQRLATGKGMFTTTLWNAIELAATLNDPELRKTVESIGYDRREVIRRGITDPQLIEQTQRYAIKALSGVPLLPRP